MSSDSVISVDGLGKNYQVFARPQDRFLQMLARGRRRYYTEFSALRDVSFSVAPGETVGIIGRNGSGKSTLLQLICGTLQQTSGEVSVRGRVAALLELGTGFNPEFTGRENVALYASILGLDDAAIAARFDSIVSFADIGEFLDQPVKTYSSGMVVRLAFAVIAHVDADVLVIDEALAVGDVYFVQKCMRFLRGFREKGTLLFVSHDASTVLGLCDRAIWLESGAIRSMGPAKGVVSQYLEGLYGNAAMDEPAVNVALPAQETGGEVEVIDQRQAFINASNLRNDIEVLGFDADAAAFTDGQADIVDVGFFSAGGRLSWMVGGEDVQLTIRCVSALTLDRPIIGFFVKNRLGQHVFGDNTYLSYREAPVPVPAGQVCSASFSFRMPMLPTGEYSLDVSISNGDQDNHQMLNWKYDVLVFRVQASSVVHGLVGVPMRSIELRAVPDAL
ncbi:MAG: ABC transporter ATP-binding protein [Halioglobus sp.]|nr:ABC transporter ATP-binding protein [Halioglobus sp.]